MTYLGLLIIEQVTRGGEDETSLKAILKRLCLFSWQFELKYTAFLFFNYWSLWKKSANLEN